MGGVESNDKERDMTIPDHLAQNFRQSQYCQTEYPSSNTDDVRYGNCTFIEAAYDRTVVKRRIRVKDDRQFATFLKNKQERMNFDPNMFVKLLDYDSGAMPEEERENNTYKYFIDCYFEHHPNDLKNEIDERRSNGVYFSADELKRIMNMFIGAGTILDNIGSRHGDIRPEFVCLDTSGKPLLMDNVRDKAGTGGRLALVTEIDVYLSPLLYKCFSRNVVKYKHDKAKDDVFSAGMVLLEAGLLESVQDCYDKETGKFIPETLNNFLEKFDQIYSSDNDLCQKIRRFLVVDEADRCRFKELSNQGTYTQPKNTQANTHQGYGQQHQLQSSPKTNYGGYATSNQGGHYENRGYGHQGAGYGQAYQGQTSSNAGYYSPDSHKYHSSPYSSGITSGYGSPQPQMATTNPRGGANPLSSRLGNY